VSNEEKSASRKKGGFLVGAIVGAAVGVLFAPRAGKETREQLFGDVGAQKERLVKALGAGKESAEDQSEALRRKIEETRARLREQMDQE
jgi:gas vesicle protein